jgi:hypothetical protein
MPPDGSLFATENQEQSGSTLDFGFISNGSDHAMSVCFSVSLLRDSITRR